MARATPGFSENTAPQAACQENVLNRLLYPTIPPLHPDPPPEGEGSGAEAASPTAAEHLTAPKRLATGSVLCYACLERSCLADNYCISGATRMLTPNLWLVCPMPNPHARLRLFCFPYAGGGSVIYRSWTAGLP